MTGSGGEIDPAQAWQPWRPSASDPWNVKWAGHLYRRAAFGASRDELLEALHLGPEGTLDLLLRGRPDAEELHETLMDVGRVAAESDVGGARLRAWWIYCMLHAGHPLREKLTLFWHNHFATSLAKVQSPALMFRQNALLRAHALGKFGPLLQGISRDPAMLLWLDSNTNVKGKPNENFARELMELFSLGVGNYSERDIREAARAFTGWRTDGAGFTFETRLHDAGPKTVLGKTGPWDGGDVVRIVLQQPAAARFVVRKLYQFLISEKTNPTDSLLEPLYETFTKSGHDTGGLVRTMLASRHFYSAHAFRQRIKGPVEYVLGAVQAVYRRYPEHERDYRPLPQQVLVDRIDAMGQILFAPPSVKGWPGGQTWLNTATVLARDNFAGELAMGTLWPQASPEPLVGFARAAGSDGPARAPALESAGMSEPPPRALDPARLLDELDGRDSSTRSASAPDIMRPDAIVSALLDLYIPGDIRPELRTKLVSFVASGNPAGADLARRVRETVHAMMTIPEYQLA
jgi:hypothetical protein